MTDGVHTISVVAIDEFGNVSVSGSATVNIDTTAPASPNSFSAFVSGNSIALSWVNPTASDFASIVVVRSTTGYPESASDGVVVTSNTKATGIMLTGLSDAGYRFSIFAYDSLGNISDKATTNATVDTTGPPGLAIATVNVVNRIVYLNWLNPSVPDFHSVTVRKSRVPLTSRSSGQLVTVNSVATTLTDADVESGVTYYSIVARDQLGNWGDLVTTSVTVTVTKTEFITNGALDQGELTITQNTRETIRNAIIGSSGDAIASFESEVKTDNLSMGTAAHSTGTLYLRDPASRWIENGNAVVGDLGGGVVEQRNGVVSVSGNLVLGNRVGSTGIYKLLGGRLSVGSFVIGNQGSGELQWEAGTIDAKEIVGSISNSGSGELHVRSDDRVSVSGNYSQSAAASVRFVLYDLAGNPALVRRVESRADAPPLLNTTGTLSLAGTVRIRMSGYTPRPGDSIKLINPSRIRSVSAAGIRTSDSPALTFDLPELTDGMTWDTSAFVSDGIVSVRTASTALLQGDIVNFPNPFRMSTGTHIGYWLNQDADVELRFYTSAGVEVYRSVISAGTVSGGSAGYNKVPLNESIVGKTWSAGIYYYLLMNNGKVIGKGKLAVKPAL
ncbi:hypothetical protein EBR96_01880 [bacterium]|nr:hypothetical protein [bacterium]